LEKKTDEAIFTGHSILLRREPRQDGLIWNKGVTPSWAQALLSRESLHTAMATTRLSSSLTLVILGFV